MRDMIGNLVNIGDLVVYADYQGFFQVGKVVDIIDDHIAIKKTNRIITRKLGRFVRINSEELRIGYRVVYTDILNKMCVGEITEIKDEDIKVNDKFWTRKEYVKRL